MRKLVANYGKYKLQVERRLLSNSEIWIVATVAIVAALVLTIQYLGVDVSEVLKW